MKKGFTLIELLIVVAIIGILAGVGIPMYNGYIASAKVASAKTNHSNVVSFVGVAMTQCSTGATSVMMGAIPRKCNQWGSPTNVARFADWLAYYFMELNNNPYDSNHTAASTRKNPQYLGQTSIVGLSPNTIQIRTNVGNTSGGDAYLPSSGYDEVSRE
jgi:type IV pilus assembly protein PilA